MELIDENSDGEIQFEGKLSRKENLHDMMLI
jgi:hypothetical protein